MRNAGRWVCSLRHRAIATAKANGALTVGEDRISGIGILAGVIRQRNAVLRQEVECEPRQKGHFNGIVKKKATLFLGQRALGGDTVGDMSNARAKTWYRMWNVTHILSLCQIDRAYLNGDLSSVECIISRPRSADVCRTRFASCSRQWCLSTSTLKTAGSLKAGR